MTEHALYGYLTLWRALNVNDSDIKFPLPPVARIVPLIISVRNSVKGGSDTTTKLDDICQERIGIRTEVTVVTSQIMLNMAIVFHRCIQMTASDDPEEYPTLYHWQNAASHRSTMKRSLSTLYN